MVDRKFSISSFLALRFTEMPDVDFTDKLKYRRPEMPPDDNRILVKTAEDIDNALKSQIDAVKAKYKKIGIFLSGGMDSSILASYLPGIDHILFGSLEEIFSKTSCIGQRLLLRRMG